MKTRIPPLLLLALGACIPSLQPLYSDPVRGTVDLPEFLGTWSFEAPGQPGQTPTWKVSRGRGHTFLVEVLHQERATSLTGHVVEIAGEYYLDTFPNSMQVQQELGELAAAHLVPAHLIWWLRPEGEGFDLHLMADGAEGFEGRLVREPGLAPRVLIEGGTRPVLTAAPERLRKVLEELGPEQVFQKKPSVRLRPLAAPGSPSGSGEGSTGG